MFTVKPNFQNKPHHFSSELEFLGVFYGTMLKPFIKQQTKMLLSTVVDKQSLKGVTDPVKKLSLKRVFISMKQLRIDFKIQNYHRIPIQNYLPYLIPALIKLFILIYNYKKIVH